MPDPTDAAAILEARIAAAPVIPTDPDALLRREAASAALNASGFPVSAATLATMVARGGGPPVLKFGKYPLYRWGTTLGWARDRLIPQAAPVLPSEAAQAAE